MGGDGPQETFNTPIKVFLRCEKTVKNMAKV
jgi:hypothetical protein